MNSRNQTVMIKTDSYDNKVYVNNELVGKGQFVSARMRRDFESKQIKVEREGYKPEYSVNIQKSKSFLYFFSWIPFGISTLHFTTEVKKPTIIARKKKYLL